MALLYICILMVKFRAYRGTVFQLNVTQKWQNMQNMKLLNQEENT